MVDNLDCENSRFFLLLAPWDILPGKTSALQRQKCPNDNVNQCFHQSLIWESWMGFQMQICLALYFVWSILVKACVHLLMNSSKFQMVFLEKNTFHEKRLFCNRFIAFTLNFVASCLSPVICKQYAVVNTI